MNDLFRAVEAGDAEAVVRAISGGCDTNEVDEGGDTPLTHAARAGSEAVVGALLQGGADPNFGTYALPLIEAAGEGHHRVVEALLAAGAKHFTLDETGSTALHDAAAAGHYEAVKALLMAGANANKPDAQGKVPAEYAAERGHGDVGRLLYAVTSGPKRERVLRLLNGEDPDPALSPDEQLVRAARAGDATLVAQLLHGGAAVNAAEANGMTALHWAANRGHLGVAKLLVEAGADVNRLDSYDGIALDYARLNRRQRVVQYLLPLTRPELRDRKRAVRDEGEE